MKLKKDDNSLIFALTAILIVFLIGWVTFMTAWPSEKTYECTGVIGDTIGGLTAPIIGIASAILVYIAFKEQKKANDIQTSALNKERKRFRAERFYQYHMELYKDNRLAILSMNFKFPLSDKKDLIGHDNVIEYDYDFAIMLIAFNLRKEIIKLSELQTYAIVTHIIKSRNYLVDIKETCEILIKEELFRNEALMLLKSYHRFFDLHIQPILNPYISDQPHFNKMLKADLLDSAKKLTDEFLMLKNLFSTYDKL